MCRNRIRPLKSVGRFFFFFCCFPLLVLFESAQSAPVATRFASSAGVGPEDAPRFLVLSQDAQSLSLEFQLPTLVSEELVVDGQTYQILAIPGGDVTGAVGDPMLPTLTRLVSIPDRAGVQVTTTVEDEEERSGIHLMPMQSEDGSDFRINPATYARDSFSERAGSRVGEPAILRGFRVVSLTVAPVSYNPAQGKVRIARRLCVRIQFSGENPLNALPAAARLGVPRSITPSFDRINRRLIVNYLGAGERFPVENGSYLVICPNDPQVTARLQPLLDWRQREGYKVHLATTAETGTTNTSIKAYIQNAYNTWSPPPEFVVLAGDASAPYNIPTFTHGGGEGDHAYTQLDGTDLISDVHIGRLSFNTLTELEVIVAKTVNYESAPPLSDPSWYTRACLVGDASESGVSTIQVMQWVKTRLRQIGYAPIDTVFAAPFVSQMAAALNQGDTIFAYRGYYGFSGWTNANTSTLTNYNKLHFAVISTCGTGSFVSGTSNSEAFLRAGTVALPKAAVGATGTATLSTHTRYNNCFELGLFQGFLYEDLWEMGAAFTRGKYELYLNYGAADLNNATDFCTWNNLMGDPACRIFTAVPTALEVSYPATVDPGANSIVVTVNEEAGGPCAEAQVCLWKGTETFVVRQTDASGVCDLPVSLVISGTMKLTVTKHNRVPWLTDIAVAAQDRFVGYQSSVVDDDNAGGSQGNGDGQINPGETIQLAIQLKNFGTETAGDVSAVLTTEDPYLTITAGSDTFGNIPAGASAWNSGTYLFTVSAVCPDAHPLLFGLDVVSGTDSWHSQINLSVVAPHLVFADSTLYNAGDNNLLDPGETIGLSVKLRNTGSQAATGVTGTLTSLSPWVTVMDGDGSFGSIPVGGTAENTGDRFTVAASPYAYRGVLALFRLVTSCNGGASDTTLFGIRVGQAATTDPVGPDRYGYYALDNTDTGYVDAPDYNWIELDPAYGGDGTEVSLGDNADGRDRSAAVDLPFAFRFYGEVFNRATICSNGWLAMGDTYLTDYRNWTIPGAGTPNNLLAVFWDDLVQDAGSKAFRKYDAANHRWIVEWSRFRNAVFGALETFEAILYDPAYTPSPTGDGQIVFQYHTVYNLDTVDGFATVGIQNVDHTDGLLYTYYNLYPSAAAPLAAGRTIRFLVGSAAAGGSLQGMVANASNGGTPVSGAGVTLLQNGRSLTTGPDGRFGGVVPPGTYTIVAAAAGFLPDSLPGVVVAEGRITNVDFALVDIGPPSFAGIIYQGAVEQLTDPIPVTATISDGSALATKELFWRMNGGSFSSVPMGLLLDGTYRGWIPPQPIGTHVEFYLHATDIVNNSGYSPADAPNSLYNMDVLQSFFSDDFETDKGWTPYRPSDTQSGRWARWDPYGTQFYGVQCEPVGDHTPSPGHLCYNTGVGQPGGPAEDSDVDNGAVTLTSPPIDLSGAQSAVLSYWRWWIQEGATSAFCVVQASSDNGTNWTLVEYLGPSATSWTKRSFDLSGFVGFTNQVRIRFLASTTGWNGIVEAAVDDFSVGGILNPSSSAPPPPFSPVSPSVMATMLYENQPNPFRLSTALRFDLAEEGTASLIVFDPAGRRVRALLEGKQTAGEHRVLWDGRDDAGHAVGAGIYFYEMRTTSGTKPYQRTRKLLLLK